MDLGDMMKAVLPIRVVGAVMFLAMPVAYRLLFGMQRGEHGPLSGGDGSGMDHRGDPDSGRS